MLGEEEWEKVRTLRASDELWAAFGESCARQGVERGPLLRRFMEWHSRHNPNTKRPTRPPESGQGS
jgi:hypothetical protein